MWENEQLQLDRELEDLRRTRPQRRITRGQRRLATSQDRDEHQENAANLTAMAEAPEGSPENNNDGVMEPERDTPERVVEEELAGAVGGVPANPALGARREMELRGAVAGAMRANGTPTGAQLGRRLNSPVSERVRDIIHRANQRQNHARDAREFEEHEGQQMNYGGARPRNRPRTDADGRGNFLSRTENRRVVSPRRAFNVHEDHGRYLARRLERMERLDDNRETNYRQDMRDMQRRHDDERALWQRQQDEMMRTMAQMQRQMDALRLQPQLPQQPPNVQVQPIQQHVPAMLNQLNQPAPVQNVQNVHQMAPQLHHQQPAQQQYQAGLVPQQDRYPMQQPRRIQRVATPVGARTPAGSELSEDDDNWNQHGRRRRERIDRRNLKLRTFKGKDIDAWKSLFDDFAEEFQWSEVEKKLQLKAHVDDWIRTMFTNMPHDTSAAEMMTRLVSRFGVNLTSTEVENKLMTIERKSGEDLYSLADRVKNLANRAHIPVARKQAIMRQSLFGALRGNQEMQHFINRYDPPDFPNIDVTLDLAIEYERLHGTTVRTERVRRVDTSPDSRSERTRTGSDEEYSGTESVNKISYIPLREMTTEEGRRLAKQNNELVSLLKKQAYTVLDEERGSSSSSSRGRFSQRGRGYDAKRSSGNWSRSRRSRSRDKRDKRDWKPREQRNSSRDKYRQKSRDRYKKKDGKFDKKKKYRDSRVAEVQDSPTTQSEPSDTNTHSNSDSDDTE